jgi:microcystin-dependent protein
MADLPQQQTIVQYVADGETDNFVVPFYTPIDSDGMPNLAVYTQAADATAVPESDINVWPDDYTYEANLDPITGGTLYFEPDSIPADGWIVTIVRDVQASLDVEFSLAQTFSGVTLDAALDKLLLIEQQNKTYANERNLSYIVNTYLPDDTLSANVNIPVLGDQQVWMGSSDGIIAATLEQPADVSTLRSELADEQPVTNGANLVGYYDTTNLNPTTVADQLDYLTGYVLGATPTGVILDFGGTSAPSGFLVCDGSAVSRATYDDLFAVIGTTWGIGDGSTTFNLPDLNGRVTAGSGGTLPPLSNTVGSTGGSATHTLTISELPAHSHSAYSNSFVYDVGSGGDIGLVAGANAINQSITAETGGDAAHTIVQPTAIVLKIIKT